MQHACCFFFDAFCIRAGGGAGLQLARVLMLLGLLAHMVGKLAGQEAGAQLQLVEDLPAEGIGLGVGSDGSAPGGKFDHGIAVAGLIVDGILPAIGKNNALPGQLRIL